MPKDIESQVIERKPSNFHVKTKATEIVNKHDFRLLHDDVKQTHDE